MNFNKDYPIAILDTNIAITVPNILNILKGCNIVIPYTLIEELDNHKKENKGARDFVNNFLALSEKTNLSKDGYKLENDCMLYLDIDKNNSYHKDINLDSKKQDIKFIAEAKNLKEKYNDMEVVLISSDKIIKITASAFDVKVKFLEEFIFENKNIEGLYKLSEIYNSAEIYKEIYNILAENNDIVDILYKLSESYNPNEEFYKEISNILANDKNINGLYELAKYYKGAYYDISNILAENKDIDGLYKLYEIYKSKEIYNKISNILAENKDIDGLYKLSEIYNHIVIYDEIFNILVENKDIDGLYKLYEIYKSEEIYIDYSNYNISHYDYNRRGAIYREKIYEKISNILAENKDIDGLRKLRSSLFRTDIMPLSYDLLKKIDYKIRKLKNNK